MSREPRTYAQKVLDAHTTASTDEDLDLVPDRVALQDALAQIVVLQFMLAGLGQTAVATTVHCDHLIRAHTGAEADLDTANDDNREVYDFLRSACRRYGIGFWEPGTGIIHQVVLENLAVPGQLIIGTDSHTPNAGGLGTLAIGVGGGDAIDAMTGQPFSLRRPKLIGVELTGTLGPWCTPKDVILHLAGRLTTSGGTGAILEYFGPGVASLSATGRATICNMGAELGATSSLFPFDASSAAYLRATGRPDVAEACWARADDLRSDPEVEADPERFFDVVVRIDLSAIESGINGPDAPDRAHTVVQVGAWAAANDVPTTISAALVGSCTNSSYEDIARAASIARAAHAAGLRTRVPLLVTPGSERVRATIERDGLLADLEAIGATVLANACGPCIGQWDRTDLVPGTANTIVNSFNRNFPRRNDGSAATKAFVTSPELVVAYALAGTLEGDPRVDLGLPAPKGDPLPARGFVPVDGAVAPAPDPTVAVVVDPGSERIQLLRPFAPWDGADLLRLPVLLKAASPCTTDHISAAGAWLRHRGHLDRISANLFLGAVNAFTGEVGVGVDPLDGERRPFPEIATRLAGAGVPWCVVGGRNYGEGSSREHAAMEPRHRGARAVLAVSFARIHETNLKKQGLLALTFADEETYDAIGEGDRISVVDLAGLAPGRPVACRIEHADGRSTPFLCSHTMNDEQLEWFRAGSALNRIAGGRRSVRA